MTKLSIARGVLEAGITGGGITGSTYAVKYSKEVKALTKEKTTWNDSKTSAERERDNVKNSSKVFSSSIDIESQAIKVCLQNNEKSKQDCLSVTEQLLSSIQKLKSPQSGK